MKVLATKLLPNLIDELASSDPDAVYAEYPADYANYEAGFKTLSYAHLANAINGTAHWLTSKLGPGENCETLAYLGSGDARYVFMFVGAIKAGYKVDWLHCPVNL
jgi:acyl-CoA synthetase (AMP-forming)/AMP-acid ligase II